MERSFSFNDQFEEHDIWGGEGEKLSFFESMILEAHRDDLSIDTQITQFEELKESMIGGLQDQSFS